MPTAAPPLAPPRSPPARFDPDQVPAAEQVLHGLLFLTRIDNGPVKITYDQINKCYKENGRRADVRAGQ